MRYVRVRDRAAGGYAVNVRQIMINQRRERKSAARSSKMPYISTGEKRSKPRGASFGSFQNAERGQEKTAHL